MLKQNILEIIKKIDKLHPNDPIVCEYWDQMTDYLANDLDETLELFRSLGNDDADADVVEELSSVFDDVALKFQSKEFIIELENLCNRFPEMELERSVQRSKDNMFN